MKDSGPCTQGHSIAPVEAPPQWSLSTLRQHEAFIQHQRRQHHAQTISIAEQLVDMLAAGLTASSGDYGFLEASLAIRGMLTNATKTYAKLLDLAISGYYDLALSLVRLLAENWAGARYIILRPDQADPGVRAKFDPLRQGLHRFAHLTPVTWVGAMVWSDQGKPEFALGPRFDFHGFLFVLFPTLFIAGDLLVIIDQARGETDAAWLSAANRLALQIVAVRDSYMSTYGPWSGRPVPGGVWLESEIGTPPNP
jgi:hypothetical protein